MDSLTCGPGHAPAPPPAPRRRAALTEGSVGPLLFNTTLPLALALAAMFAVQLAETWLVGLLGREALAATRDKPDGFVKALVTFP